MELFGKQKADAAGMVRSEVKFGESGETGWVTIKGNGGATYFDAVKVFEVAFQEMEKEINVRLKNVNIVSTFLGTKMAEGKATPGGPLSEARAEMMKLRPKTQAAVQGLDALRKKLALAKRTYYLTEKSEL